MGAIPLYWLKGPTGLPSPPEVLSYSALNAIERCPLQWQLLGASYEGYQRFPSRPNPAGIEGDIVHDCLEKLLTRLAAAGFPPIGSPAFREVVQAVSLPEVVEELCTEHEARIAAHPRGASFRLRSSRQQIVNMIVRLLREQYEAVRTCAGSVPTTRGPAGAADIGRIGGGVLERLQGENLLAELPLRHPSLPFRGVLDLVYRNDGGTVIADFKSGTEHPEHETQVKWYGVLWWRSTEDLPVRGEIVYRGKRRVVALDERTLREAESDLGKRVEGARDNLSAGAAQAKPGEHCKWCDVRQFCDAYWKGVARCATAGFKEGQAPDLEMTVRSAPTDYGFEGLLSDGAIITVVFDRNLAALHGPFRASESLRVIRAAAGATVKDVELKEWTEVFHRP